MCLILIAYKAHRKYPLIILSNRDEFYARPSVNAHFWKNNSQVFAGQDLQAGGTWMGITTTGRLGIISNFRSPKDYKKDTLSRGLLVKNFLESNLSPDAYLEKISHRKNSYNPFNLIVGTILDIYYYSNRTDKVEQLMPGLHGLSNALLNTQWPKVKRGKKLFRPILSQEDISIDDCFELLSDRYIPSDNELPNTGVGLAMERVYSSIFIANQENNYGTCSSSVLLIDVEGNINFIEKVYNNPFSKGELFIANFKIEENSNLLLKSNIEYN